jgi:alkylation response protein AidB-like acyl-CoA dehydrogenase
MIATDVHESLRQNVRRMVDARIRPNAIEVDERAEFPRRSMAAFNELELLGLAYPTELGGGGGDLLSQVIVLEEVARACASSASILLTSWAALTPIIAFGSDALKQEVVPEIAAGEQLASFCLTEPGGGSDLPGLKTRAERAPGGWRLHGHKRFISNAQHSEWYAVLARSGAPKEAAFGVFLVHKDAPGLSFGAQEKKMGMRGFPTADVILDEVFVPDAHVVGDPARGYSYMMDTLTYTRPLVGAHALGIAQGALDASISYTAGRTQFGSSISKFQMVREMVSDMMTAVEAARSLLYRSAEIAPVNDERARAFASMAKVFCSDTAMKVTTDAVQLHGGNGYMRDYQVERMMRDAKVTQIWEGTNHIQKLLISKYAYTTV